MIVFFSWVLFSGLAINHINSGEQYSNPGQVIEEIVDGVKDSYSKDVFTSHPLND